MKTKKLNELVNDFFGVSALIMCLLGVTLAMLISFTDNNDFSQGPINATMLLMLAVLILQTSKFIESSDNEAVHTEKQTLDTRLLELTNSLAQAGNAISAIEREINGRQELVEKLEKQKVIAEEAINLSKDQVDAVSALLSEQVSKQRGQDNKIDWIKQILFFILGVLATIVLTKLGLG